MSPLDEKLAELRQRFIARSGAELAAIDAALRAEDRETLIERAHAIAGVAGMFGFTKLGEAALELEQAARTGDDIAAPAARLLELLSAL